MGPNWFAVINRPRSKGHDGATLMNLAQPAQIEPVTVTVEQAKRITSLGTTTLYDLMKRGTIRSTSVGGRRLIFLASLRELLEAGAPDNAA